MIVGRGVVAKTIKDREGFTFFCAGLSNREPITDRQKHNELNRIWRSSRDGMFVYISTISIYYADNEYVRHKLDMENLVKRSFDNYCIVRIGNLISKHDDNPNTLLNKFRSQIENNEPLTVYDTYRYLIDADELNHWIEKIPPIGMHEMNITGRRMKVADIVTEIKNGRL